MDGWMVIRTCYYSFSRDFAVLKFVGETFADVVPHNTTIVKVWFDN